MTALHSLPTRETVLAHGFPEGLIDHYRQQARIARARAMAAFLAAVFRNLVPGRPVAAWPRPDNSPALPR